MSGQACDTDGFQLRASTHNKGPLAMYVVVAATQRSR